MEKLSCKDWFCLGCRILLGLIFIVSATLKLVSLDAFELYIFGFEWFNFGVSTYLARSVILAEYFVGGIFLFTLRNRWIDLICGGLLGGFSLFLFYSYNSTMHEIHCHRFEQWISFVGFLFYLATFAQLSFRPTVRLKTGVSAESLSLQK